MMMVATVERHSLLSNSCTTIMLLMRHVQSIKLEVTTTVSNVLQLTFARTVNQVQIASSQINTIPTKLISSAKSLESKP